jgi:hypothetical protein
MRRLPLFVSSALLLAGGFSSLWAQHGGGSGGHSSGGRSASSSGFHASSSSSSASHNVYPTLPTPIGLQRQYAGLTGINPGALPTGPYRTGRGPGYGYGSGRRYGFASYGYYPYFPLFDNNDDSSFYNNSPSYGGGDPAAQTAGVNANLLGEQVERLSAEVEALRSEREQDGGVPMPRSRYNAPPLLPADETPASAPITLILRDGKQLKLNSYAVMGQEIWDFSSQPAKKIALASLNLEASQKATEAAGGEFPSLR